MSQFHGCPLIIGRPLITLQGIPQYIEVPPNIEAKRIISNFNTVLSYSSNPPLFKGDSKLSICFGLLAD